MTSPILVILPNNPGDVVMALQAVGRLKSDWPSLSCDYLVSEECKTLVQGSPLLSRVHVIPKQPLQGLAAVGDYAGGIALMDQFLRELATTTYLLSLNFFQDPYGGVLQSFVTAKNKIGLELSEGRNFRIESRFMEHLAAVPAARGNNGWHAIDLYLRAAGRALTSLNLHQSPRTSKPPANWTGKGGDILPRTLRPKCGEKLLPGQFLVFHPGSAWPGKCWPADYWAQLATLCHQGGLEIAFTGAREEQPIMDRILKAMDAKTASAIVDSMGKTTLLELAWIVSKARLVVTGDTVAMHLAAATGTPTLALFGPSNPVETGPYGRGHVIVQTDPHPLPNFPLAAPHTGLCQLRPESIAGYILSGENPAGALVWQTEWDLEMGMQILRNARQELHPDFLAASALMKTLDQATGDRIVGLPVLTGVRETLRCELDSAIANLDPVALQRLEGVEQALAKTTQANLIWEAYRIAINGLSLQNLAAYLLQRKERFNLAIQEEYQASRGNAI